MSSVSADSYFLTGGVGLRLKRSDDVAAAFAPSHADDVPTIILVVQTTPGSDNGLADEFLNALERASARRPHGDGSLGFSRAIPENAVPTVREACSLLRNQAGYSGSITAFSVARSAVERVRGDDARHARAATDARDRASLEFNELSIDPARREVWVEGSLIGLTKSEFDLLYVLAQRPGVVFSRRQIVLAYKGADYPVDDRSIDVQMFNLRRKIRSAGSTLQTIRGVGYRFTGTTRV